MATTGGRSEEFSPLQWVAVALAVVTGLVHLTLGVGALPDPLGFASVLAAGAFGVGILLYVRDFHRKLVLALGVPFVATQIVLWYALNQPSSLADVSLLAALDKPVQVILIVVMVLLYGKER